MTARGQFVVQDDDMVIMLLRLLRAPRGCLSSGARTMARMDGIEVLPVRGWLDELEQGSLYETS